MGLGLNDFGSRISFSVYPAAVYGNSFDKIEFLTTLDEETARLFIDTQAVHANVYSTLPSGTPNDPTKYKYLKFRLADGSVLVIGEPLIIDNTIVRHTSSTLVITIPDINPVTDYELVKQLLLSGGYTKFNIDIQ